MLGERYCSILEQPVQTAQHQGGPRVYCRLYNHMDHMARRLLPVVLLPALWLPSSAETAVDPERWLQDAEQRLAQVDSYTAVFHKQERIGGELLPEEVVRMKFKRPFKVYIRWFKPPLAGQEALYVEGANNGRIKGHAAGLLGLFNVNLDPRSKLAMRRNRHPITESGIESLVKRIGENIRKGLQASELTAKELGEEVLYGRKTKKVEGLLPKDASKGYYCYRSLLNIDLETKVPIQVRIFDWEDQLIESYGYEDLKLDAGLTDADFDPKNPQYRF